MYDFSWIEHRKAVALQSIIQQNTIKDILKSATIIQYTIKGRFMSR